MSRPGATGSGVAAAAADRTGWGGDGVAPSACRRWWLGGICMDLAPFWTARGSRKALWPALSLGIVKAG